MVWNLGIAGFAFANMCSAGPFMERRVSIFGCFVGATKEAQHDFVDKRPIVSPARIERFDIRCVTDSTRPVATGHNREDGRS